MGLGIFVGVVEMTPEATSSSQTARRGRIKGEPAPVVADREADEGVDEEEGVEEEEEMTELESW